MPNQGSQLAGACLRHCLASSADLHARCVIGAESLTSWAKRHDLDWEQVRSVYAMLRSIKRAPSRERRAAILMRDPGLEDGDIAEMLFMDVAEVEAVRADVEAVRAREPIPEWAELMAAEMHADDPEPAELYRRAAELRAKRVRMPNHRKQNFELRAEDPVALGIRQFFWSYRDHAFIPRRA
jgi:hypothetical protein